MFKLFPLFHFTHNELHALWEYESIKENEKGDFFIVTWKVSCQCGIIKHRKRAYMKYKGYGKKYSFEHTKEEAIELAKLSKGDNYHI